MSKSVLVIDMPKYCIDCPCHFADDTGAVICGKESKPLIADDIQTYKPDWCPLRELPEKMQVCGKYPQPDGIVPSYKMGWNACLDAITGEIERP